MFRNSQFCFNSRTPGGVRPAAAPAILTPVLFQFTHPRRGATADFCNFVFDNSFQFTHPRRGATRQGRSFKKRIVQFQFTHPRRGATRPRYLLYTFLGVSIHAPQEGCDKAAVFKGCARVIVSIHAPQEGCDIVVDFLISEQAVSIHAPQEGCDGVVRSITAILRVFQFTHPRRGATSSFRWRR